MRLIHIAIAGMLLTPSAFAAGFIATNSYVVAKGESIEEEQWISASAVEADGTYQDDLLVSSGTRLMLSGIYEGNLWGAAGTEIEMSGVCLGNVRLAAISALRISGAIEGNLLAAASTISISTNTAITGHVRLLGNQVIVEGEIDGSLTLVSMRTVTLSGTVRGDAKITAPDIIITRDARIHGDLTYTTDKELIPAEQVVGGRLERIAPESPFSTARVRKHSLAFIAALLTGIAFISIFPMTSAMASLLVRKSPLKCLLIGFISVGALPVFALVSLSSAIGFPLGAILLAAWGIMVYTSRIVVGLMIGTAVLRAGQASAGRVILATATGLAIIYLLTFIPSAIGGMIQLLVIWMGMGALLLALHQKRKLIIQVPEEIRQLEALKREKTEPPEESQ
jgi:cytoskeletal protein CcmA (bactofilin family)